MRQKVWLHDVEEFGLSQVTVNTLAIERTFLDKVMSVKRHAICGSLMKKIRHVYDVTMLFHPYMEQSSFSTVDFLKRAIKYFGYKMETLPP